MVAEIIPVLNLVLFGFFSVTLGYSVTECFGPETIFGLQLFHKPDLPDVEYHDWWPRAMGIFLFAWVIGPYVYQTDLRTSIRISTCTMTAFFIQYILEITICNFFMPTWVMPFFFLYLVMTLHYKAASEIDAFKLLKAQPKIQGGLIKIAHNINTFMFGFFALGVFWGASALFGQDSPLGLIYWQGDLENTISADWYARGVGTLVVAWLNGPYLGVSTKQYIVQSTIIHVGLLLVFLQAAFTMHNGKTTLRILQFGLQSIITILHFAAMSEITK